MDNMDYEIFSLPKQEVLIISKERHDEDSFLLGIKSVVIKVKCTKCGGHNTKRVGKGYNEQIVNHMFLSNYSTVKLKLYKRRFICSDCDICENTFIEGFSFVGKNCSYTDTYAQYILREREYSSLKELSRKFKVSETLIYKVIKGKDLDSLVKAKINEMKDMEEIYLGIDEVSFSGRDMICTITDVKQKKVLGVLPTRKKSDLVKRLNELDIETLKKIKGIATDMNATYKKTVQEHIGKRTGVRVSEVGAKAVADHFHIVQMLMKRIMQIYKMNNWMIRAGHYGDEIQDLCNQEIVNNQKYRTDKLQGAEEYIGEYDGYKAIQLGFFLSKSYVNLLCMKQEQQTDRQKDRLGQIFSEFDPCGYLKEAWIGKELLMKGIQEKSISMIDELISNYEKSKHYLLQTTGKTLKKRREEIQNFFDLGITNAFTEGKNTKIKLFKRMAYGYIKKENYMKRILICL